MLTGEICLKLHKSTKTTSRSLANPKLSAANHANQYGAREIVSIATRLKSTLLSVWLMSLIWLARNIIALTLVCTDLEDVRTPSGPGSSCSFGSVGLNRVQELRITAPHRRQIHRLPGATRATTRGPQRTRRMLASSGSGGPARVCQEGPVLVGLA